MACVVFRLFRSASALPLRLQYRPVLNGCQSHIARTFATSPSQSSWIPSGRASTTKEVVPQDVLPLNEYINKRTQLRAFRSTIKQVRRLEIGPIASITFENYDLLWIQIQEMLFIEQGGPEQVQDELAAYNPLIPKGSNLSGTLMFGIENVQQRKAMLGTASEPGVLGGVEKCVELMFDRGGAKHRISAIAVESEEIKRSTPEGRTSAVHFLRFDFTPEQKSAFGSRQEGDTYIEITHPNYRYYTRLSTSTVQSLSQDFD
eukprot:GILK01007862.1.p1 GENE.GILK01007862.1~~GILK01007862.1.p1  ORF type:complete len:260 (+),score=32.86 GILK01007862.1:56-835(+)